MPDNLNLDDALNPQEDNEPQPVAVPPIELEFEDDDNDEGDFTPVPIPPPTPVKEENLGAISLIDEGEMDLTAKKKVGAKSTEGLRKTEYKREMNITGTGATRFRLFNSRIADVPLAAMEGNINEWIDENGIEVKQASQMVATLEGKRAEENIFVMVWY